MRLGKNNLTGWPAPRDFLFSPINMDSLLQLQVCLFYKQQAFFVGESYLF